MTIDGKDHLRWREQQPSLRIDLVTPQVVVPLAPRRTDELAAAALLDMVRREGLDLRRRMCVAYVIDFAQRREDAYAAERAMRATDWDTALYGDASGWVLRLSRSRRLTADAVTGDLTDVNLLAERCHGQVRGVAVEDLQPGDVWSEMASQLQTGGRRRSDDQVAVVVPAQRADPAV